jgi:hypothetical protein
MLAGSVLRPMRASPLVLVLVLLTAPLHSSGIQLQHQHHHHQQQQQLAEPLLELPSRMGLRMDAEHAGHAEHRSYGVSSNPDRVSGVQRSSSTSHEPERVSVVMLNWQRPRNVQKIIRKYVQYEVVDEIIVWMCHPDTRCV